MKTLRPARSGRARLGMMLEPLFYIRQTVSWNTRPELGMHHRDSVLGGRGDIRKVISESAS